jgi:DNA-binding IclR family transcriptional regulator
MTKPAHRPFGLPHHLIPLEQLPAAILRTLQIAPRTVKELSGLVGYSESELRRQLVVLESDHDAHRTLTNQPTPGVRAWVWHFGAGESTPPRKYAERAIKGEMPRRRIRTTYPNVGRRDPLVSALFGHAGSQA